MTDVTPDPVNTVRARVTPVICESVICVIVRNADTQARRPNFSKSVRKGGSLCATFSTIPPMKGGNMYACEPMRTFKINDL